MKHQKPLAVRIFIRICVIFMTVSLIGVYVVYMFAPSQEVGEDAQGTDAGEVVEISGESNNEQVEENLILPEVDPENPENTQAPIVTEEGEINEMDQMVELQLENGETEIVRQGDLGDAIQIN